MIRRAEGGFGCVIEAGCANGEGDAVVGAGSCAWWTGRWELWGRMKAVFVGGRGRVAAEGGARGGERAGGGFAVGFDEGLVFEFGEEGEVLSNGRWVLKLGVGARLFDRCPSDHSVAVDTFYYDFRYGFAAAEFRRGNTVHGGDSACGHIAS